MTIRRYLTRLSAKTPAPGGGSVAALTGALATALLSMTAGYALNRAETVRAREEILSVLRFAKFRMRRLTALMDKDEAAYRKLAKELRTPGSKNLLKLYKGAIDVPLEVCKMMFDTASECRGICGYCKTSIVSDAAEAVVLCEAAFLSAKLNVEINLRSIKDPDYRVKIEKKLRQAEFGIVNAKRAVFKIARNILK